MKVKVLFTFICKMVLIGFSRSFRITGVQLKFHYCEEVASVVLMVDISAIKVKHGKVS